MTTSMSRRLRRLLAEPGLRVSVGVYDGLSAKLAEQQGFERVLTSGFGIAATTLGMPDWGLLTATETLDRVRPIVRAVAVPVVADLDTGYGNPLNVMRTVREAVEAGGRHSPGGSGVAEEMWALRRQAGYLHGGTRRENPRGGSGAR